MRVLRVKALQGRTSVRFLDLPVAAICYLTGNPQFVKRKVFNRAVSSLGLCFCLLKKSSRFLALGTFCIVCHNLGEVVCDALWFHGLYD
jgi:hypothetical protein